MNAFTLDNLRHREIRINEIWETENGQYEQITRFGGWIDNFETALDGAKTIITLRLVDQLNQFGTSPITLTELPEEYAHQRIRRIFTAAGVDLDAEDANVVIGDDYAICPPVERLEGTVLELVQQVIVSTGGNFSVIQNQKAGSVGGLGKLVTRARQGPRRVVATLSDRVADDELDNGDWENIIELDRQVANKWDTQNIYNIVNLTLPDGAHFNDGEPERDWDSILTEKRGELLFPLDSVVVDQTAARSLARYLIRAYGQPRLVTEDLPVSLHFRPPRRAINLAKVVLGDFVRLSARPGGQGDHLVQIQRVIKIASRYEQGDRQYAKVTREFDLLTPRATEYWTLSLPEANRLDTDTRPAPALPGDDNIVGTFEWEFSDDDQFNAFVTAERFRRLWSDQCWPVYPNEAARDGVERRVDGLHAIVFNTEATPKYCHLTVFSEADNQWLIRGELSEEDANPSLDVLQWDVDRWDDGNVWGA